MLPYGCVTQPPFLGRQLDLQPGYRHLQVICTIRYANSQLAHRMSHSTKTNLGEHYGKRNHQVV